MKFVSLVKHLLLSTAILVLAACGGGGGSGEDSVFDPPGIRITATPGAGTVGAGGYLDVTVRVAQTNGSNVADGTIVSSTVSPAASGTIRYVSAGNVSDSSSGGTVGGNATFRFIAGTTAGSGTLTFSTAQAGRSVSTTVAVTVTSINERLQLQANKLQLPPNIYGVEPFLGSPYMAEVTITVKDGNGQPVNLPDGVQVSLNPVDNTGGFSTLDDPETEDVNEFTLRMGQAPVDVVAGKATVFVHSLASEGTATLTVTTQDPVTGVTIENSLQFAIVSGVPQTPTQLTLQQIGSPAYVQGSGGNTTTTMESRLLNGLGMDVPDPVSGSNAWNNYRLEIIGNGDGTLSGVNAAGQTVSGKAVNLRTSAGIGYAVYTSGETIGTVVMKLTADAADNNVDNGISSPVSVERTVVVSDGRLWDIEITQPIVNALQVNPVDPEVEVESGTVPSSPDGTYSLTVGVIATDRLGNPVLPGTTIRFGLIDEPQLTGIGDFRFAGGDGDPQEGGKLFTAPITGDFIDTNPYVDDEVGPGDTLVIFGEEIPGNRDLESARIVESVVNDTTLRVTYRFNHNDDDGTTEDDGAVLPYIVGRAADGNIVATATTNDIGVARTKMNYPVSKLGKVVVIWAQGDGMIKNGSPETVTDVEFASFAGVSPARLYVVPNVLPANTTAEVDVCVTDYLSMPLGGVPVSFAFQSLTGSGSVDGVATSGWTASPTQPGTGCTTATVTTGGLVEEGTTLVFSAVGETAEVTFTMAPMALIARPSVLVHNAGGTMVRDVVLQVIDASGAPVPGVQIVGTCTGDNGATVSITGGPGVTDANGETIATITGMNLTQAGSFGTGECVFQNVGGSLQATVTIEGVDICANRVSPLPAECGDTPSATVYPLTIQFFPGTPPGNYMVQSSPAGINCTHNTLDCEANFSAGTLVTLTATTPVGATFSHWEGCSTLANATIQVTMDSAKTCRAYWEPAAAP